MGQGNGGIGKTRMGVNENGKRWEISGGGVSRRVRRREEAKRGLCGNYLLERVVCDSGGWDCVCGGGGWELEGKMWRER